MKPVVKLLLAVAGLVALGAAPQPRSARAIRMQPARPSFVDRARYNRSAANAVRRASLAFLTPKRLSAKHIPADAHGDAGASSYTVLNLNAFIKSSGVTIDPLALNNAGQIVGASSATDGTDDFGYIINASGANGSLAHFGYSLEVYFQDFPTAISNDGKTAVGFSNYTIETYDSTTNYIIPLIWTLAGPTTSVEHGSSEGPLYSGVSDRISVAGPSYVDNKTLSGGSFPILSCPISDFSANGVNDSGVIVGRSQNGSRATVLALGGCPTYVPNLGVDSFADAVATNGDMIVGNYGVDVPGRYSLWAKGRVYPIPLLTGYDASKYSVDAIGLNASDVVVGNVVAAEDGTPAAAFVYTNGKSTNLQALFPPNSGWTPAFVTGINDSGEIIGQGYLNGVLTPFALRK